MIISVIIYQTKYFENKMVFLIKYNLILSKFDIYDKILLNIDKTLLFSELICVYKYEI